MTAIKHVCINKRGDCLKNKSAILITICIFAFAVCFYFYIEQLPDHMPAIFLMPIVRLVELFTGLSLIYRPDIGYYGDTYTRLPFVINKSCSGSVFFLICLSLLALTQLSKIKKISHQLMTVPFLFLASYLSAIAASFFRIICSIFVWDMHMPVDQILVHNVISIITFVVMINLIFMASDKLIDKVVTKVEAKYNEY